MPWETSHPPSWRPERPREPGSRRKLSRPFRPHRFVIPPLHPGHRPAASALGSVLPARWAGWGRSPKHHGVARLAAQGSSLRQEKSTPARPSGGLPGLPPSVWREPAAFSSDVLCLGRGLGSLPGSPLSLRQDRRSSRRRKSSLKRHKTSLRRPDASLRRLAPSLAGRESSLRRP